MDLGWVSTNAPPVAAGKPLCVCAESLWLWNRMPLRIVYRKEGRHKLAKAASPAADLMTTSPRKLTGETSMHRSGRLFASMPVSALSSMLSRVLLPASD